MIHTMIKNDPRQFSKPNVDENDNKNDQRHDTLINSVGKIYTNEKYDQNHDKNYKNDQRHVTPSNFDNKMQMNDKFYNYDKNGPFHVSQISNNIHDSDPSHNFLQKLQDNFNSHDNVDPSHKSLQKLQDNFNSHDKVGPIQYTKIDDYNQIENGQFNPNISNKGETTINYVQKNENKRHKKDTPTFSGGSPQDYVLFKSNFLLHCRWSMWSEEEKYLQLCMALKDEAHHVVISNPNVNFDQLLSACDDRYTMPKLTNVHINNFETSYLKGGENFTSFADHLVQLCDLAHPDESHKTRNKLCILQFMKALKMFDTNIHKDVACSGPHPDLATYVYKAQLYQSYTTPSPSVRTVEKEKSKSEVTCWQCGEKGHIRPFCPELS